MTDVIRIMGVDPGLRHCGWGVVDKRGWALRHVAHGVVSPPPRDVMGKRLKGVYDGLVEAMTLYTPNAFSLETAFVHINPATALKLGQARSCAFLAAAHAGLDCAEYEPRAIKKAVTGTGRADKVQIAAMIRTLLPTAGDIREGDAADALAVAICHAHHCPEPENTMIKAKP